MSPLSAYQHFSIFLAHSKNKFPWILLPLPPELSPSCIFRWWWGSPPPLPTSHPLPSTHHLSSASNPPENQLSQRVPAASLSPSPPVYFYFSSCCHVWPSQLCPGSAFGSQLTISAWFFCHLTIFSLSLCPALPPRLPPSSSDPAPAPLLFFLLLAVPRDSAVLCVPSHFSCVRLFATWWTVALQAPLSTGFSRQEYCSGLVQCWAEARIFQFRQTEVLHSSSGTWELSDLRLRP